MTFHQLVSIHGLLVVELDRGFILQGGAFPIEVGSDAKVIIDKLEVAFVLRGIRTPVKMLIKGKRFYCLPWLCYDTGLQL